MINITPVVQNTVHMLFQKRIKLIMEHLFNSVKHKFKRNRGYFDLYGLDFMVDSDLKIYLIEVNANPCLATNCSVLRDVVPNVVRESLCKFTLKNCTMLFLFFRKNMHMYCSKLLSFNVEKFYGVPVCW